MEEKILDIIKKIREMYRFDKRYKNILIANPHIALKLNTKGNVVLDYISWNNYDSICATEKHITFHGEHGAKDTLIEYNGWDALLKL